MAPPHDAHPSHHTPSLPATTAPHPTSGPEAAPTRKEVAKAASQADKAPPPGLVTTPAQDSSRQLFDMVTGQVRVGPAPRRHLKESRHETCGSLRPRLPQTPPQPLQSKSPTVSYAERRRQGLQTLAQAVAPNASDPPFFQSDAARRQEYNPKLPHSDDHKVSWGGVRATLASAPSRGSNV